MSKNYGPGLVAIIEGSGRDADFGDEDIVYLELYYKHGEWAVSSGYSELLSRVEETLADDDEFDLLEECDQWDQLICLSKKQLDDREGQGVAATFQGTIYAQGESF